MSSRRDFLQKLKQANLPNLQKARQQKRHSKINCKSLKARAMPGFFIVCNDVVIKLIKHVNKVL